MTTQSLVQRGRNGVAVMVCGLVVCLGYRMAAAASQQKWSESLVGPNGKLAGSFIEQVIEPVLRTSGSQEDEYATWLLGGHPVKGMQLRIAEQMTVYAVPKPLLEESGVLRQGVEARDDRRPPTSWAVAVVPSESDRQRVILTATIEARAPMGDARLYMEGF